MQKLPFLLLLLFIATVGFSQKVDVKYDKKLDFSLYKTFSVGEGEIFTPEGERKFKEEELKSWIREALVQELKAKGLTPVDTNADLHIDFVAGALQQTQFEDWGPMGYSQSPDPMGQGSSRTWSAEYSQGSMFLDFIDTKVNKVVWNATATVNLTEEQNIDRLINEIVAKSLRKFPVKSKKKK